MTEKKIWCDYRGERDEWRVDHQLFGASCVLFGRGKTNLEAIEAFIQNLEEILGDAREYRAAMADEEASGAP